MKIEVTTTITKIALTFMLLIKITVNLAQLDFCSAENHVCFFFKEGKYEDLCWRGRR